MVRVLRLKVSTEIDFSLEGSSADLATEWLVPCVLSAVRDQIGGLAECFAANLTLVGLLTWRKDQNKQTKNSLMIDCKL